MNKAELDQNLEFLYQPDAQIQIIIYALLKDEEHPKRLDIEARDLPPITQIFLESIQNQIIRQENHSVVALSHADERANCFYEYDLEVPDELSKLNEVIGNDNLLTFDFRNDSFTEIDSLIIVLASDQQQVSLYKKISPLEVIGRSNFLLFKAQQRIRRFEDNLLRISSGFQALMVQNSIIILNLNMIEKSFGFTEVIRREAALGVEAVRNMGILTNIEVLHELINNVTFARKLTKIARASPVILKNIPNLDIIAFAKTHPATRLKFRYDDENMQISLDTNVSKNLFIKLLNDDFLTSELTKSYYDSLAKDDILDNAEQ